MKHERLETHSIKIYFTALRRTQVEELTAPANPGECTWTRQAIVQNCFNRSLGHFDEHAVRCDNVHRWIEVRETLQMRTLNVSGIGAFAVMFFFSIPQENSNFVFPFSDDGRRSRLKFEGIPPGVSLAV